MNSSSSDHKSNKKPPASASTPESVFEPIAEYDESQMESPADSEEISHVPPVRAATETQYVAPMGQKKQLQTPENQVISEAARVFPSAPREPRVVPSSPESQEREQQERIHARQRQAYEVDLLKLNARKTSDPAHPEAYAKRSSLAASTSPQSTPQMAQRLAQQASRPVEDTRSDASLSHSSLQAPKAWAESKFKYNTQLYPLLKALIGYGASDLHLKAGRPPLYRIHGKLVPAKMYGLEEYQIDSIVADLLSKKQLQEFETKRQLDLSVKFADLGRFRFNVYYQRSAISIAVRIIPSSIPSIDQLGLPAVVRELCKRDRGLILVTGATGSGKSTTMASMVQEINRTQAIHIISIEDPIEYLYRDIQSSVTQREIGSDATSFQEALVASLRQDPDVILIGEMRDSETIEAALSAAETGHLVISTLHTNDAKSSIDRMVDAFKPEAQSRVRMKLASSLVAVLSQHLMPNLDESKRVLACEVMVKSPAIELYIQTNELEKIPEAIANSGSYYKMQSLNQALEKLILQKKVSLDEALRISPNPDDLKMKISGLDREEGYNIEKNDKR